MLPSLGFAVRQPADSALLAAVRCRRPELLPVVVLPTGLPRWRSKAASSGPGARVLVRPPCLPPGPVPPGHAECPGATAFPQAPGGAAASAAPPPPGPPAFHLLAHPWTRPQLVFAHRAVSRRTQVRPTLGKPQPHRRKSRPQPHEP